MNKITYNKEFNTHPINTDNEKGLGCYEKALKKIDDTLTEMIQKHNKVLVVRFDVRYPDNQITDSNNNDIYRFTYNLKRSLNRENANRDHNVDAKIIHVEEKNKSINPHHHFAVFVNGNAKNKYYPIVEKANKLWKKILNTTKDGLIDYCNRKENGIMIDRNNDNCERVIDDVFYQLSYLAKTHGKQDRKKGSWLIKSSH